MNKFLKIMKALGDPSRLRIVNMLSLKPMCVCEIRQIIGSSMSTISNHLKILRNAHIITSEKEERFINYHLRTDDELVNKVLHLVKDISDKQLQKDLQKAKKVDRVNIC
ncbi:MAG: winged helix-turn-helix transcriptional regulator [Candidatus Cloacimonetes bacterium]|nr:winged helix-turn-helix transcriptional regulator [Candidatus Cloacimonadota bacterium]